MSSTKNIMILMVVLLILPLTSAEDFSILAHNKLKERIGASPVAVDDVLYMRTDKHLYAFREK